MSSGEHIGPGDRLAFAAIAEALIPAEGAMPAPAAVGIADEQLDRMLAARPDLIEPLQRALAAAAATAPTSAPAAGPDGLVYAAELESRDPEAHQALLLVIAGGYYTHPLVRERLGLTAAGPEPVRPEVVPAYVEEGLLDHLLEGGRRYREPTGATGEGQPAP